MTRDTKIGLLVGMGVIIFIGILISDHLSTVQQPDAAALGAGGADAADSTAIDPPARTPLARRSAPLPAPAEIGPDDQVAVQSEPQPRRELLGPAEPASDRPSMMPLRQTDAIADDRAAAPVTPSTPGTTGTTGRFEPDRLVIDTRAAQPVLEDRPAADRVHHVQEGETLAKIARQWYGDADYYMTIYEANQDKLPSPDAVRAGVRLVIPNRAGTVPAQPQATPNRESAEPTPATTEYTVREGESLSKVAAKFYGSGIHWQKLYELNRDRIDDPDQVPAGTVLRVPAR